MEYALIDEYEKRGLAERVKQIANYDYQGSRVVNGNWYQVHDLYMLAMTGDCISREYRELFNH